MVEYKEKLPIYQIDAFTDQAFRGNPAAICIIEKEYPDDTLQKIAAEMNLSETAFLYVPDERNIKEMTSFRLRWFTPKIEVNLCGHATLATAALLLYEINIYSDNITFHTLSGELLAYRRDEGVVLDFPLNDPEDIQPPEELLEVLGIDKVVNVAYSKEVNDILVELENEEQVKGIQPDFEKMKELDLDLKIRGVMITAKASEKYDFVSRFFAPWAGINEDPVTGSAHTILTPYWSKRLNKKEMLAFQMSERGGKLRVKILENNRVEIAGNAILVFKGELYF
ncbi:MAG: PhzF family phenazine biosynthesis protein [Candidatus Thorarchaeota archaeon]